MIVPAEGDQYNARLVIVGESPGAHELREGRPFVGPSGQLLNQMLGNAKLPPRESAYVTNVIKTDAPIPKDVFGYIDAELLACRNARVIIALGSVALEALAGKQKISEVRGSPFRWYRNTSVWVVPTYHPAAILRNWMLYYPALRDLTLANTILNDENWEPQRLDTRISTDISELEAIANTTVAVDIEVAGNSVVCIAFSHTPGAGVVYPLKDMSAKECVQLWRVVSNHLFKNNTIVFHNAGYDLAVLHARYGILFPQRLEDTMVAMALVYSDLPKSLAFCTSFFTTIPFYKDERVSSDWHGFFHYCAKDAAATLIVHSVLSRKIEQMGLHEHYRFRISLIEPLTFTSEYGMLVDTSRWKLLADELDTQRLQTLAEISNVAGRPLNPDSPKDMARYFYSECKVKPYINRDTHNPTTNEEALRRLSTHTKENVSKVAQLSLKYREITQLREFLQTTLTENGELTSSFCVVGSSQQEKGNRWLGRLSSHARWDGVGRNTQNLPKAVDDLIVPRKGYVITRVDLSQAENRIFAYVAGVRRIIDAFERNIDTHSLTASLIFGKDISEISPDERQIGKRCNHALNYGMGVNTFAIVAGIPTSTARYIWERFHAAYPEIQAYWRHVENILRAPASGRVLHNLFGRPRVFLGRFGHDVLKNAIAYVPQSTCAELTLRALLYIYENNREINIINTVHDSIWLEVPCGVDITDTLNRAFHYEFKTPHGTFSIPFTTKTKGISDDDVTSKHI